MVLEKKRLGVQPQNGIPGFILHFPLEPTYGYLRKNLENLAKRINNGPKSVLKYVFFMPIPFPSIFPTFPKEFSYFLQT